MRLETPQEGDAMARQSAGTSASKTTLSMRVNREEDELINEIAQFFDLSITDLLRMTVVDYCTVIAEQEGIDKIRAANQRKKDAKEAQDRARAATVKAIASQHVAVGTPN